MTDSIRFGIYCVAIVGYMTASAVECTVHEWKAAILATLFGIANAIIFLWR